MRSLQLLAAACAAVALIGGCHRQTTSTPAQTTAAVPPALSDKPLYQQSPAEIDRYLAVVAREQPNLQQRVIDIARRNIGQPYELYLLGEAPFETIDAQPVYCLDRSDCVVFVEHTLAMALSRDFPSFMKMLQRIRYKDGAIGVLTRNHYTEADWNVNNRWLEHDISADVAGSRAKSFKQAVNRAKFFKDRYKLDATMPVERIEETYVPFEAIPEVKGKLRTGDIVNFVKGTADNSAWVHHVGFVAVQPDGAVHLIHSTPPHVREEPIEAYIAGATENNAANDAAGKPRHRGFKFLRLHDDALARLKQIDGTAAPKVTTPSGSDVSIDAFIAQAMLTPATKPSSK